MGIFSAGSNNCSSTGKFFNDALGVMSLGFVSGPTDEQCSAWKWNKALEQVKKIPVLSFDMYYSMDKIGRDYIEVKKTGEIDYYNKYTNASTLLYDPHSNQQAGTQDLSKKSTQDKPIEVKQVEVVQKNNINPNEPVQHNETFNIASIFQKYGVIIGAVLLLLLVMNK